MANRWFARDFAVINLAFVSFCVIGYVGTVYSLVFWTFWRWPPGELGGVLDYRWLGMSVVYHTTQGNLETVFSFPDFTSYLLIGFIVLNLVYLFLGQDLETTDRRARIRNSVILGIAIAVLSEVAYVWTMMFVDSTLRSISSIGGDHAGVVQYQFPIGMLIVPTFYGTQESWNVFRNPFPDVTGWLLLVLLILAVKLLRWKPKKD